MFREFDPDDPVRPARIEQVADRIVEMVDPRDAALLNADPATLGLVELRTFIRSKEAKGLSSAPQRALLYSRLADWVSIAPLVAIGLALGLGVERSQSLGRSAAWATMALAGYYSLRNIGSVLSAEGVLAPAVAPILLVTARTGFAAIALARAPR